ncbi:MAG: hypothetical protein A2V88_08775 [Elusimicrobia bacterium RBG_16_66_12]|nr:MAG: hypothetical protein A2V88_08775 [Elusimicrobia bacterium RBG_16_66_12]
MTMRQRAVSRYAGTRPRLCAECGSRLVITPQGLVCPGDSAHCLTLPMPSASLALVMARWERGLEVDVPPHSPPRLAYWLLRRHSWGDHRLCARLAELGGPALDCARPEAQPLDLW